jgi:hypothetical protein
MWKVVSNPVRVANLFKAAKELRHAKLFSSPSELCCRNLLEAHRQYPRVYVTRLRQKIESDPASPSLIKTEPGIGYRFVSNEAF